MCLRLRLLTMLALILPAAASATGVIGLYEDTGGTNPEIIAASPAVAVYEVVLEIPEPAQSIRFRVQGDAEFQSNTEYLSWVSEQLFIGNARDGVIVYLSPCQTGLIHVGTVTYFVGGDAECATVEVVPDPNATSGEIELQLCDGSFTMPSVSPGYLAAQPAGFPTHWPPTGATGVATNAVLTFAESYCYVPGDCFGDCRFVYFGPDPGSLTEYPIVGNSFDPGPLETSKTYVWQVSTFAAGTSPLWYFTTSEDPVAAEATTWGRIKSLYR